MSKRVYKGSLLAQKILNKKLEKTILKEDLLRQINPHYRRLEIVQLVSIIFGGFIIFHFFCLVVLTVLLVLLSKLYTHFSLSAEFACSNPLEMIWLNYWPLHVVTGVLLACCLYLDEAMTDKMKELKKTVDDKQLMKDYLVWEEELE
ncbi:UNVERIFIED_CONTAM: hypothetical protein KB573_01500 [Streptococcus canis]|uniref:hypothetical protein n=1 Tax=Streptococcus canis TaxID=1329 RepID=UPI001141DE8D|nr:hypothetical protein [Streptococcus canis]MDV6000773.1 hypothetical protein [Streptococcus canis]MDV6021969.1 hypothetical protein [Streptococcus canis]GEE06304.1 hypothetical protein ScOT1_03970 [Streptococcus canis]